MPAYFPGYPTSFPSHSRASSRVYHLRSDCFASASDAAELRTLQVLETLPEEELTVFSGSPPADLDCRPVYAFSEEEPPAVPTGRVFVQCAPGASVAEVVDPLGYEVESVPAYAPQAAWLVARDHSVASALSNLPALMAAPGLDAVEPQMLRPAVLRAG